MNLPAFDASDAVASPSQTDQHAHRRLIISIVLSAIAVLTAPLFLVAAWTESEITNTDRYLKTIEPLADNPQVQQYVADELTKAFAENVDVTSLLQSDLPTALQPLSGTMATAIDGFVATAASRFTASPAFKTLWVEANRVAHNTISRLLTGELEVADLENGQLSINIGDALRTLQQRLVADGFSLAGTIDLSNVNHELVLADGPQIDKIEQARNAVGLLHDLVWIFGIVALLAGVGSILVAPAKSGAVVRLGIGLALGVLIVILVLAATRRSLLSQPSDVVPSSVTAALFDAIVASLRFALRLVFALAVVLAALVAIISLPTFADRWARPTQIGVAVLTGIALLIANDPTWGYILVITIAFVTTEVVLELVRRRDLQRAAAGT